MRDPLSGGRLELGIGRGISPIELGFYGVGREAQARCQEVCGMNIVTNGPAPAVRAITDAYRNAWLASPHAAAPLPLMGMSRYVVIADSDAGAVALAEPAYRRWFASLLYLRRVHGTQIPPSFPEDFRAARQQGLCRVGSLSTVRKSLAREIDTADVNYLM
jgi:alkanesulfonate monooxygenase SsuD/methylene tetrahydromethanopterin reductase-like flavin-dependent oxidoreductase (luciferase family)